MRLRLIAIYCIVALATISAATCGAQAPLPVQVGDAPGVPLDLSRGLPRMPGEVALQEPLPAEPPAVDTGSLRNGPPDLAAAFFDRQPTILQRAGTSRVWSETVEAWEAPALYHRPLYFEDEALERFGRSYGLAQPAVSAAHFAGRIAAWPYLAGAFPPHECIYTLGRGRPGTCAPYSVYRPPVSARGALYQAGVVAGFAYLVP